jgi:hypothetical protein
MVSVEIGAAILAAALAGLGLRRIGGRYFKFRGTRVTACPETQQPAAVELALWNVVLTAVAGEPALRVRACSQWRERTLCDQACLNQIRAAPEESLVRTIRVRWYEDKICVCCGAPLVRLKWGPHKPALMSPEMKMVEWREIRPESIPKVLATHEPVCRNCLIAEMHIS